MILYFSIVWRVQSIYLLSIYFKFMHAFQCVIFGFNMLFLVADPFLTVDPYQSKMIFIIICWFNMYFKINWHPSIQRNCLLEIKRKENKLPTLIEFHAYRRIKQEKKCNEKKHVEIDVVKYQRLYELHTMNLFLPNWIWYARNSEQYKKCLYSQRGFWCCCFSRKWLTYFRFRFLYSYKQKSRSAFSYVLICTCQHGEQDDQWKI